MARSNARFARQSGVFTCGVCNRQTRVTSNSGHEGCELCEQCFDLAGWDNSVNDGNTELEEIVEERDRLLAKAVKLGSDGETIKKAFTYLWPKA